jgi:hypothetical protein
LRAGYAANYDNLTRECKTLLRHANDDADADAKWKTHRTMRVCVEMSDFLTSRHTRDDDGSNDDDDDEGRTLQVRGTTATRDP